MAPIRHRTNFRRRHRQNGKINEQRQITQWSVTRTYCYLYSCTTKHTFPQPILFYGRPAKLNENRGRYCLYKTDRKFRPITSLDISFQLCEKYWAAVETELVIDCGSSRQFGGVKGRSASDPLIELELLYADAEARQCNITALFSDKTSAYDSLNTSLFPLLYARWGCPAYISNRFSSVCFHHKRQTLPKDRTHVTGCSGCRQLCVHLQQPYQNASAQQHAR